MRKLKIAFLMNPLENWDTEDDTSLSIMTECHARGHHVYFLESRDLILFRGRLHARVREGGPDPAKGFSVERHRVRDLGRMDAVILRKEPPFNGDYLACTFLLDFLAGRTFVMNSPSGVRAVNEKIGALTVPDLAPDSAVCYDAETARWCLDRLRLSDAVLKRIDLKGGEGILRTGRTDDALSAKTASLTADGMPVIVQRFVEHSVTGDKRILLLDGLPLGAFARIPGPHDFRANMMRGGRAERSRVDAKDRRIVAKLRPFLRKQGLHFVGIDVLGGRLSEVNVTSPAGIPEINRFDGVRLERRVVDYIQKKAR